MARRWQRPRWFAVFLTLAGIAFFARLGIWQVDRAHEKELLFAAFAGTATEAPISLEQARRDIDPARYPLVEVSGRFDAAHAYVLDNQQRNGEIGVMLFDVFEPGDGSVPLLANMGFLARTVQGERAAIPPPPQGVRTVRALYAPPPSPGLRMGGNALPAQSHWPKTSIYIDIADIEHDLGRHLDPRVLLLLPEPGNAFVREWRPDVFPPARHYAYAATWFTFALIAVLMFVILHWREESN